VPAGYSVNPLFKKLGLKEGLQVILINAPVNYKELIGEIHDKLIIKKRSIGETDFVHFFTNSMKELEQKLPELKLQIKKDGMIWVSWYKKTAGKTTELDENKIRSLALVIGLVDVKVCAIDEDWSGLKLVYRIKDR
jgi:Protein of unknown function (DUF3052)